MHYGNNARLPLARRRRRTRAHVLLIKPNRGNTSLERRKLFHIWGLTLQQLLVIPSPAAV